MPRSGVYAIANNATGHEYIGSSINLSRRRKVHFSLLRSGRHPNAELLREFRKYGKGAFSFHVLAECHPDILLEVEQYFIDERSPLFNTVPPVTWESDPSPATIRGALAYDAGLREMQRQYRESEAAAEYEREHSRFGEPEDWEPELAEQEAVNA